MRRNLIFRNALPFYKRLETGFDFRFACGKCAVVFADALIPDLIRMTVDQRFLFPKRIHRFRVQLHTVDRRLVRAAPVEIDPSVIIDEEIRIPVREGSFDLLIRSVQDILRAVTVAVMFTAGGAEIYILSKHPHIRRIVI